MIAKLHNIGPFHLFFTLSCGDTRYNENFSAFLVEKGYEMQYFTNDDGTGRTGPNPWSAYVECGCTSSHPLPGQLKIGGDLTLCDYPPHTKQFGNLEVGCQIWGVS